MRLEMRCSCGATFTFDNNRDKFFTFPFNRKPTEAEKAEKAMTEQVAAWREEHKSHAAMYAERKKTT